MSLSFLIGLFRRIREDGCVANLRSTFKAQSDRRESFFKDVIKYAYGFMDKHRKALDKWKAETMIPIKNLSDIQMLNGKNSIVADKLGWLVEEEISKFFSILEDQNFAGREEVHRLVHEIAND